MKQKKIDKVLEEFKRNGSENLEFKDSLTGVWIQSTAINEEVLRENIYAFNYKYRIKKSYLKSLEVTKEPVEESFTDEQIFEEFTKNGCKNLEMYTSRGEWVKSAARNIDNIKDCIRMGARYRIKDSEHYTTKLVKESPEDFGKLIEPIKERPMVAKDANPSVEVSMFYRGKYLLNTNLYFVTREEAENYVNYLNTLEKATE